MTREGMSWAMDGMSIIVKDHGIEVMRLFLGEAMESAGRELVEQHIKVIERTTYLRKWHNDEDGQVDESSKSSGRKENRSERKNEQ